MTVSGCDRVPSKQREYGPERNVVRGVESRGETGLLELPHLVRHEEPVFAAHPCLAGARARELLELRRDGDDEEGRGERGHRHHATRAAGSQRPLTRSL